MQVTGNDILGYTGNVALGLNSEGLGAYGDTDTRELNNAMFNLAYLNMQKNKAVWEQKIRDRDDAMKLVVDGRLRVDNALPEDQKKLQGMIEEMKTIWKDRGGDLKSDPNVWVDFNDKLGKFKNASTIAASRFLDYNHGQAEIAKETNPIRRRKMTEHWEGQLKTPMGELFKPYQQTLDWDPGIVLPELPTLSSVKRDGYYDVTSTKTDVAKSYRDYVTKYQFDDKGETAINVDAFYDNFFGVDGLKDIVSVGQSVNAVNSKLKTIATDAGYDPDKPETWPQFLQPLQLLSKDPSTGRPGTTDTKQVAAFKVALAHKYQNVSTPKLNKDYAAIEKTKADIDAAKALAAQRRSSISVNQARARYWNAKSTTQANTNNIYNIFNDVVARSKNYNFGGKEGEKSIVWVGDLPKGFTQVLAGIDKDGKPIALKPLKRSNGAEYFEVSKSPYYISGTGKRYSESEIRNAYASQSKFTSYEEFLADMNEKGFKQETELVGSNGRGTSQATIQALRSLSNKSVTQKDDEELFQQDDNLDE